MTEFVDTMNRVPGKLVAEGVLVLGSVVGVRGSYDHGDSVDLTVTDEQVLVTAARP